MKSGRIKRQEIRGHFPYFIDTDLIREVSPVSQKIIWKPGRIKRQRYPIPAIKKGSRVKSLGPVAQNTIYKS